MDGIEPVLIYLFLDEAGVHAPASAVGQQENGAAEDGTRTKGLHLVPLRKCLRWAGSSTLDRPPIYPREQLQCSSMRT
eukprot:scaffold219182_cov37-Tisochrysis_lutea.AAC.2